MTAEVVDDTGVINFSPQYSDVTAQFSNQKVNGATSDSKIYDARIKLTNLPADVTGKKVEIKLPIGILWVDDASGSAELRSQLDTTKGNNGIEQVSLGVSPVLGYNFAGSGTRVYYISDGAVSLAINIKVKLDTKVNITEIESAISAKVYVGGSVEEAKVKVLAPTNASTGGTFISGDQTRYIKAGAEYTGNFDNEKNVWISYVNGHYGTTRLIEKVEVKFRVSDPRVKLRSTSGSSAVNLDTSDSDNGNYTLTYRPSSIVSTSQSMPYAVVAPNLDSGISSFTVTETGKTVYWQVDGSHKSVDFANTRTITYYLLPDTDGVTVGASSLDPNPAGTAFDTTASTRIDDKENLTGLLGYGYINNRSSNDSVEKEIHYTFDTEVLGVQLLRLAGTPGGRIHDVTITTKSGITKTVDVDIACTAYGLASKEVSYATFGIDRDDYIKDVKYKLGVIPAATQIRNSTAYDGSQAFSFHGRRLDTSRNGVSTVEIYDADNPENTTGIAKIYSRFDGDAATVDFAFPATKVVNAGNKLSFNFQVYTHGQTAMSYNSVLYNPVIYIRQEAKDAAGNFLPISNLKITNGSSRGNQDITSRFGQISYEDTETARVYKIDSSGITDGSASLATQAVSNTGTLSWLYLDVSYDVETNLTTPSQTYNIQDAIFVQNAANTSLSTWNGRTGNIYRIGDTSKTAISPATTNYYQIRGWASIGVENSGKHTSSSDWITWSEGSNPITIGAADGSIADMKTTLINNSGVDVPGPTVVYLPVPKKDQNWGSLSYNNQAFEFSTALTGAIANPDSAHFVVAYGKNVTPTDNGASLDAQNSKFSTNTSAWTGEDWAAVNCIKIVATNIPANTPGSTDEYDFIYQLKVIDAENVTDGVTNAWRPVYFQQLTNSAGDVFAGWYKGSYVSIKLADGKVSGQIFVDANENGKKDSGEQDLKEAGWKVDLYDKTSNRLVRSTETDANGKYSFIELAMNDDGYYISVTNKHPIDGTGTTYLFTPKGNASNTGAYNTDNQAEGSKTSTPAHATAYIGPVSPSKVANEASYNIGVVEYVANETYSGTVTFNDQNNLYNTRPANITITATASDNSTQDISAPAGGDWTAQLPRYNISGEKLSYTFSAQNLTNYSQTDETQNNGYEYNVSYVQKTATLTVHHYKKNTTDELANAETSTVYWGQPYSTAPATVDSNYEYDSATGSTSGTIAGDITVDYYYKLKRGTVITHYYVSGSTTQVADDVSDEYDYTSTYTTSPLVTIPETYKNYELVSAEPEGYTGTVQAPTIDVIYYYQKKDPSLSSSVTITAPELVNSKTAAIAYRIAYQATLKDYVGGTTLTLTDKLPYPIDEEESSIDGGTYDAENQTITWATTSNYDTYANGESIAIEHEIELVYVGALARDMLINTVESTLVLDNKSNDSADSAQTEVRTPSKIIIRFTDPDGNEIRQEIEEDGYVGDEIQDYPIEVPGYRLVGDEVVDRTFGEDVRTITYHYEKIDTPNTYDDIIRWFILALACVGLLATLIVRRRHIL